MAVLIVAGLVIFLIFFIKGALEKDKNSTRHTPTAAASHDANSGLFDSVLHDSYFGNLEKKFLFSQRRLGAVGEQHYKDSIRQLVGTARIGAVGNWDSGLEIDVRMVPEPSNPHDANAVALFGARGLSWYKLGYIRADLAPVWAFLVRRMAQEGLAAICKGFVYRDDHGGFQVVLHVSDPEHALALNSFPVGAFRLAAERQATVMGSGRFPEPVDKLDDGEQWATLSRGSMPSGKFKGEPTLDVQIDGQTVGYLSHAQGSRYMPVLRAGQVVACEAVVMRDAKNPVSVYLPKVD